MVSSKAVIAMTSLDHSSSSVSLYHKDTPPPEDKTTVCSSTSTSTATATTNNNTVLPRPSSSSSLNHSFRRMGSWPPALKGRRRPRRRDSSTSSTTSNSYEKTTKRSQSLNVESNTTTTTSTQNTTNTTNPTNSFSSSSPFQACCDGHTGFAYMEDLKTKRAPNLSDMHEHFFHWVDYGMDLFGCDGDFSEGKSMLGRAFLMPHRNTHAKESNTVQDEQPLQHYSKLHEEFFNAMLQEQLHLAATGGSPTHANITSHNHKQSYNTKHKANEAASHGDATAPNTSASSVASVQSGTTASPATAVSLERSYSRDDSISSCISSVSSHTSGTASTSSTKTRFRRRPMRLRRTLSKNSSSNNPNSQRMEPIDAYDQLYNPAHQASASSFAEPEHTDQSHAPMDDSSLHSIAPPTVKPTNSNGNGNVNSNGRPPMPTYSNNNNNNNKVDTADPSVYMHPECVLQKDKGKGDPLGKAISATGQAKCLAKLREKMAIVVQVSGDGRKSTTGMKRRPAKVAMQTPTYIETRSMIELRLGFLSMQYGLLLHWDYQDSEQIVFMVLRKMCHDSFYTKIPPLLSNSSTLKGSRSTSSPTAATSTNKAQSPQDTGPHPPMMVQDQVGNQAIYQQRQGTEVVLVHPPYHVLPPDVFPPSMLSVNILQAKGLDKKAKWTLSMTFDGHTEVAHLAYQAETQSFRVERDPMQWEMAAPVLGQHPTPKPLEIRLFRQQPKKKKKHPNSTLASLMTMPLGGLVSQPAIQPQTSWQLTVPFSHDPQQTQLSLELVHESDYAHWLYQEMRARQVESEYNEDYNDLDEDEEGAFLDWITCGGECLPDCNWPERNSDEL